MSDHIYPTKEYHHVLEVKVNNKVYVCKHTNDIPIEEDNYTGSGDIVKRYVKMFGKPAKQKLLAGRRIICECATEDEAYDVEEEIVDWKFVHRKDTLNKVPGGEGGSKGAKRSNKVKADMSNAQLKSHEENPERAKNHSDTMTKLYEDSKNRERQRAAQLKAHEENPEIKKRQSVSQIKRFEDPKEHEKASIAQLKRYEDPKEQEKMSDATKKYYEDPKARKKRSKNQANIWSNRRSVKSVEFVDVLREACRNHK